MVLCGIWRSLSAVIVGACVGLAVASPAHSALSPLYQSIREIQAILDDPRLAAAFPNQAAAVTAIEVPDVDVYQISAGTCSVDVRVVDLPPKPGKPMMIGPRQFTLEFDEPICAPE